MPLGVGQVPAVLEMGSAWCAGCLDSGACRILGPRRERSDLVRQDGRLLGGGSDCDGSWGTCCQTGEGGRHGGRILGFQTGV